MNTANADANAKIADAMPNTTTDPTPTITTSESLVTEARRRGFKLTGAFMPRDLIPMVEAAIAEHNKRERGYTETSCDYIDWKQTMDNLHDFLALLKTLPPRFPPESQTPRDRETAASPSANNATTKNGAHNGCQAANQNSNATNHNAPDTKIKKQPAAPPATVRSPQSQQHPPVCAPSDTRPNPVRDPSAHAPNASGTPAADPQKSTAAEPLASQPEYILLHENPSQSPIDDFPPERQLLLYTLIIETNCAHVARLIAKPEPLGWNFKTSDTSLKRFKKRYRKKLERAEHMAAFHEARTFLAETAHDEQSYMDATQRLLKIRLYKNAADPEGSDDKIELFLRLLDRQRRTDLAERRVRVAEQRAKTQ